MMKKSLLFGLLFLGGITLTGCIDIMDGPGMVNEPEAGGEWFSVAEGYCADEGGKLEIWEEGDESQAICFFEDDESYCYFEDLYDGLCHKGDLYYYDDMYPYAEQACIDSNGQVSQTELGENICILNDDEFCYMDDIMDGACDLLNYDVQEIYDLHEGEREYQEYVAECYEEPQVTVCGKDGNSYYNRCFMEKAGVEEEIELAEVVDGECVFG